MIALGLLILRFAPASRSPHGKPSARSRRRASARLVHGLRWYGCVDGPCGRCPAVFGPLRVVTPKRLSAEVVSALRLGRKGRIRVQQARLCLKTDEGNLVRVRLPLSAPDQSPKAADLVIGISS